MHIFNETLKQLFEEINLICLDHSFQLFKSIISLTVYNSYWLDNYDTKVMNMWEKKKLI